MHPFVCTSAFTSIRLVSYLDKALGATDKTRSIFQFGGVDPDKYFMSLAPTEREISCSPRRGATVDCRSLTEDGGKEKESGIWNLTLSPVSFVARDQKLARKTSCRIPPSSLGCTSSLHRSSSMSHILFKQTHNSTKQTKSKHDDHSFYQYQSL
jgi:hypothetical protein